MTSKHSSIAEAWATLALVVASSLIGLMGTDLVLPAVPLLPDALGGSAASAQLVLASYGAGSCAGLILYGVLADHFSTQKLFVGSLVATALLSFACSLSTNMEMLIAARALQGLVASGPAVFAPGIVKALYDEHTATRAFGLLGSIESMRPAVAPVFGAGLLLIGTWRLNFDILALLATTLAIVLYLKGGLPQTSRRAKGQYITLLRDMTFLRYALSQAFVLGGLLTFVFGMPMVFVEVFGGTLRDFIVMQMTGIFTFMIAANSSSSLVKRFGAERTIYFGTGLAALGAVGQFAYAKMGGTNPWVITVLFVPVNSGLGFRGPIGFFRAVIAAHGDDARGSALVILGILGAAALGTALASPWILEGTIPLTGIALGLHLSAVLCLALLPALREGSAEKPHQ